MKRSTNDKIFLWRVLVTLQKPKSVGFTFNNYLIVSCNLWYKLVDLMMTGLRKYWLVTNSLKFRERERVIFLKVWNFNKGKRRNSSSLEEDKVKLGFDEARNWKDPMLSRISWR